MFIHSHDLIIRHAQHAGPMRRRLVDKHGVLGPPDPARMQPVREHGLDGRIARPPGLVHVLVRHEHHRQPPATTRRDLRGPRVPARAARDVDDAAAPPARPLVVRHDVLEAEVRAPPRRLEHHDERLGARRAVPRARDPLHAVAQVLVARVAPQAARRGRPGGARVARVHAEGLLVVLGELARVRELHERRSGGRGGDDAHEGLPETQAAAARGGLLRRLRGEAPRAPAVRAAAHRDAEVRGLPVLPARVVAERRQHRRALAPCGDSRDLEEKPVVDVAGPARDLAEGREGAPVVGAAGHLEHVRALQHARDDAQQRAVGQAAEAGVRAALV